MNVISDFNRRWTELLASERCPPILGLAPLSEEDSEAVSSMVRERLFRDYSHLNLQSSSPARFHNLLQLLRLYPAIMGVWLARKAGEAYEFGKFWELFAAKLDVLIPPLERPRFTDEFQIACKKVMLNYVEPTTLGAFKYVETFLFQAGLPLCYCQRFADCMREVERRYGLPDPESTEAGIELQESILTCTAMRTVPILKRAIQGAAGPLICYAALQVLLEAGHAEINPALKDALWRAFANQQLDQLHRSARFPYLRISEDLGSLEIIGPRQESNLVTLGGLTWVVNGVNYRTPHWDEFVLPVHENTKLTVELLGLRGGLDVSRTFNPQLNEDQPFMIFDFAMRKQRRVEIGQTVWLKSGMYWLFHPIDYSMTPETMRNEWLDGDHAVSLLQLHPGDEVQLTGPSIWRFKADRSPFCEVASNSKSLATDEGERIYYAWDGLMNVWIPAEVAATHWGSWSLGVAVGENCSSWSMSGGEAAADMLRCRADVTQFLTGIPPGLHRFEVTVSRPGRKPEFTWQFWYWIGLDAYNDGRYFLLTAMPGNLLRMECRGFDIANNAITHRHIESPRHLLAFNVSGRVEKFHWTQSGVYLESFEKRAGRMNCPQSHTLGETFSASIDSPRFLRIWQIPVCEAELMVNNQRVLLIPASAARSYVDVSLAHLSTIYPNGGEVLLRRFGENIFVARFTRPLTPIDIIMDSAYGFLSLRLRFLDKVCWVKPRVHELTLGEYIQVPEGQFDSAGHIVFSPTPEQFPPIECSILTNNHNNSPENLSTIVNQIGMGNIEGTQNDHRNTVIVKVPQEGWPPGLWLIDLEVRRDLKEDWQVVMTSKGKLIPLLVSGQCEVRESPRQRAFWTAYESYTLEPLSDHDLVDLTSNLCALFDLLGDVSRLVDPGIAEEVRHEFYWLEHLFHEVGRLAGKALITADERNTAKLLNLACIETGRGNEGFLGRQTLFVTVPELLALPADHYAGISTAHPLAGSLRWCARLAVRDSVFDVFRSLVENIFMNRYLAVPEVYRVLQCFQNFNSIIQTTGAEEAVENLTCFNYYRYFHEIIGELHEAQVQPEWDERTVLSRAHIEWALSKFAERRQVALDNIILGRVTALLNLAQSFRDWLMLKLQPFQQIMPLNVWAAPWLDVSMENDAFMEHCCRFASVFALASRAAAAERTDGGRWLCFEDVIAWLTERGAAHNADEATTATLVGMAPELFGYYLMFWELMIRTYPHD